MPYPQTSTLPTAPSRIDNPLDFTNRAALYLDALPTFKASTDALTNYFAITNPNLFNFGNVTGSNPTKPVVSAFSLPSGSGLAYVSSIDAMLEAVRVASSQMNSVGQYIDAVVAMQGTVETWSGRPVFTVIPSPPNRLQSQATFNSYTNSYFTAFKNYVDGINTSLTTFTNACYANDDCGALTDGTIATTYDAGALTDPAITN